VTILQLAANRWWTGSADPVLTLVRGLRDRGHRVLLGLIRGDRFEAKARAAGVEPLRGLVLDPRGSPLAILRDLVALRRIIRAESVQIVHVHHSHDHWLAALAGGGGRLVRTFHNAASVRRDVPSAWLYARTDAVIAVSGPVEARCRAAHAGWAQVYRGRGVADLARFGRGASGQGIRAEFKVGGAPLVGCVARLAQRRGHRLLIDGFRLLLRRLPEARLLLVGKGEARAALEAYVAERSLGDRVLFAGYRDQDLPDVLAALDCFALMAAGSDESCRAALEAMAAGLPVVGPRVGALPDTVVHGETGLLLDDDRATSVAAALAAVLGDRERARAMGRAGRRRAETEFSPARLTEETEAIYRSLVNES
jgi:glycosyltransferase involved in cell wall biosynthesis